jgi:hypothetical protein
MIEYYLVQKEADPLNMNLIDLAFPKGRFRFAENFCGRQEPTSSLSIVLLWDYCNGE